MLITLDEYGVEREIGTRLLGVEGGLLRPFLARQGIPGADESEQAVVIRLLIVLDQRVVVTLGALHVAAEEDPSDVPRDQVRLGLAIQIEPRGGAELRVGAIGPEELAHQLVEGTVRAARHAL